MRTARAPYHVGGNLEGLQVGDDCSSFVFACLYQQGLIPDYAKVCNIPSTKDYLPTGWFGKVLAENGFVWISRDELCAEDLHAGDILLKRTEKSGHVEVFDYFDENGVEYAYTYTYTWGQYITKNLLLKEILVQKIFLIFIGVYGGM